MSLFLSSSAQQDLVSSKINWKHSATNDLRSFIVCGPATTIDLVDGFSLTPAGNASGGGPSHFNRIMERGPVIPGLPPDAAGTTAAYRHYRTRPHKLDLQPRNAITVMVCFFDNGNSSACNYIGKVGGSWNYLLSTSSEQFIFDLQTSVSRVRIGNTSVAGALNPFHNRWVTGAGTYDGALVTSWTDVMGVMGTAAHSGTLNANTDTFAIGDRGSLDGTCVHPILWGAVWGRALSVPELESMASNPYDILMR